MQKRIFSQFCRKYTNLGERIYPGGTVGRATFNGRVVTVFGGYGFLGANVIAQLGKKGTQIVAPHRCPQHEALHLKIAGDLGQVYLSEFDPYDLDSIMSMMQYSDTVINCIGNSSYAHIAKKSNIDVPRLISEAVSKSPNVKTFLHVSSMGQNNKDTDVVSKTKHYGEILVKKTTPDAIIVRPSTMYHNPDWFVCLIGVRRNLFYVPIFKTYGHVVKIPTSTKDVAKAIAQIVLENKYHGKTFELYGNDSYYMRDIYDFVHYSIHKHYGTFFQMCQLLPMKTFVKFFPELAKFLGGLPPHFTVDDVISKDNKIYTYRDLAIDPIDTEDGIREAIGFIKPYADQIPHGQYTRVYEQPHLRLISKKIRDHHQQSSNYFTKCFERFMNE